jgi:hypothetical protein
MHASPPRLPSLASPAFIAALALLVTNDFLLKPMFHNWTTGKLSDFAGLFALAIFCATFSPRRPLFIGVGITAAFAFWKSVASQPLIDWLNGFAPFPIARTVDYTDLWALPAVWLGLRAAHRIKPWPLPRVAELALALFATIAFTATSTVRDYYAVRVTAEIAAPSSVTESNATAVQTIFDEVASKHHLPCKVCDPLADGRVYSDGAVTLTANFTDETQTVFFRIVGGRRRSDGKSVDQFSMDIRAALGERFPDLKLTGYVAGRDFYGLLPVRFSTFTVHLDAANLDVGAAESAQRTLSQIVEDTVREHGLRIEKESTLYYAGKRTGTAPMERDLVLMPMSSSHQSLGVRVAAYSDAYEPLQRAVATTLEQRLDAAFGAERVTVQNERSSAEGRTVED